MVLTANVKQKHHGTVSILCLKLLHSVGKPCNSGPVDFPGEHATTFQQLQTNKSRLVFFSPMSRNKNKLRTLSRQTCFCKSYTDSLYVLQSKHVACDACKDYSGFCVSLSSWFNKGKMIWIYPAQQQSPINLNLWDVAGRWNPGKAWMLI